MPDMKLDIIEIETKIGKSSKSFLIAVKDKKKQLYGAPAYLFLKYRQKPATKFLQGLGTNLNHNQTSKLSFLKNKRNLNEPVKQDIIITSYMDDTVSFKISAEAINKLIKSGKIYVNTDVITLDIFEKAKNEKKGRPFGMDPASNLFLDNLALGVCHSQEIYLLVEHVVINEEAIIAPRKSNITIDTPAILLLSAPGLNFIYGAAGELEQQQKEIIIAGMYRNLFNTALQEGRSYIVMPGDGLNSPSLYFTQLIKVAKEFPELSIIYNPGEFHEKIFVSLLQSQKECHNLRQTNKDVMFLADELVKNGYSCALHNPSSAEVIYGLYDIGKCWKESEGEAYRRQEHIGAMTTAVLGSYKLNPEAYKRIVTYCSKNVVNSIYGTAKFNNFFTKLFRLAKALQNEITRYQKANSGWNERKNSADIIVNSLIMVDPKKSTTDIQEIIISIQQHLENINNHKPTGKEKDIIEKITDILSSGIKPLIKELFFSEYQRTSNP